MPLLLSEYTVSYLHVCVLLTCGHSGGKYFTSPTRATDGGSDEV